MSKYIIYYSIFFFALIVFMAFLLPESANEKLFISYFLFLTFTVAPMGFILGIKMLGLGDKNDG